MTDQISSRRKILAWASSKFFLGSIIPQKKDAVLMYHRIIHPDKAALPLEPGMYVTPQTFEKHLKFLVANLQVVSLEDYINNITRAKKDKLIALTFDDAWIDFKENAYPLLESYNIPACVFIPTKFIDSSKLFWTDIIGELVLRMTQSPEKLLNIQRKLSEAGISENLVEKFNLDLPITTNLESFLTYFKSVPIAERKKFINSINNLLKEDFDEIIPSQFMTWDDLTEILENKLISAGQHSHSHNISTEISLENLKEDLYNAQQLLISKKIAVTKTFCYPNEIRSRDTDQVLLDLGFESALGKIDSEAEVKPVIRIIDRIGIHEDISKTDELFKLRIKGI